MAAFFGMGGGYFDILKAYAKTFFVVEIGLPGCRGRAECPESDVSGQVKVLFSM
jgi:hypothetical protein